ncbi:MAG: HD domain-containing protein [Candidatus Limnocylindrales bacterium]
MPIPDRRAAATLLTSLEPPPWFLRHACAVADVAAWLAGRMLAQGVPVDVTLAMTAALLHDVDKLPRAAVPARLRHGDGSAAWLEAHGLGELAPVVRDHPVTRLAEPGWDTWIRSASPEARIVAYADKRAGQRLETMDERFASWRRRYPTGPSAGMRGGPTDASAGDVRTDDGWTDDVAALVKARAGDLERLVCAAAGVSPPAVRRLRWSRRAILQASA